MAAAVSSVLIHKSGRAVGLIADLGLAGRSIMPTHAGGEAYEVAVDDAADIFSALCSTDWCDSTKAVAVRTAATATYGALSSAAEPLGMLPQNPPATIPTGTKLKG